MRSLWLIISTLALANLLAVGGFMLWLRSTDRINLERARQVREILAPTLAAEAQRKAEEAVKAEEQTKQAAEAAKVAVPPVPAGEQITERREQAELEMQQLLRQQQELSSLRLALMNQLRSIEEREQKLVADRKTLTDERAKIAEIEGATQFKTALTTLEAQKPRDAAKVLHTLIDQKETEQVVAYLSKMDDRRRAAILTEFLKDDAPLAANLLERIRTRGVSAMPAPTASTEPPPRNADTPTRDSRPALKP